MPKRYAYQTTPAKPNPPRERPWQKRVDRTLLERGTIVLQGMIERVTRLEELADRKHCPKWRRDKLMRKITQGRRRCQALHAKLLEIEAEEKAAQEQEAA